MVWGYSVGIEWPGALPVGPTGSWLQSSGEPWKRPEQPTRPTQSASRDPRQSRYHRSWCGKGIKATPVTSGMMQVMAGLCSLCYGVNKVMRVRRPALYCECRMFARPGTCSRALACCSAAGPAQEDQKVELSRCNRGWIFLVQLLPT